MHSAKLRVQASRHLFRGSENIIKFFQATQLLLDDGFNLRNIQRKGPGGYVNPS